MNTVKIEVPEYIKHSNYGCKNCLWCGVECKKGSMLKEENKSCENYTYYD